MSDIHPELSQLDPDTLPAPVAWYAPTPPPCTVTLADPVAAPFHLPTILLHPRSAENICDALPAPRPDVTTTRSVRHATGPVFALMLVSDDHVEPSTPVRPTLAAWLLSNSPPADPCTLTTAEPVAAPFRCRTPLIPPDSNENSPVTLPTLPPTLTPARPLPPTPPPTRHRTPVSDTHPLLSQPVPLPALPPELPAAAPIPAP